MNYSFQNIPPGNAAETPILFLPGWGFDGRMLALFRPRPNWIFPTTCLDPATLESDLLQLASEHNIKSFCLVGWSMGAMLALDFAARHPELTASLALASLRNFWPAEEITAIRSEFTRGPEGFMKNFFRKCFLGAKTPYREFCKTVEPLYLAEAKESYEKLLRGLDYLEHFRISAIEPDIPVRLIHGRQDIIAPVDEMAKIPGAANEIIENAGHVVFLHDTCSLQQDIKKQVIRQKFSRAANSYDSHALVQKEAALRLAARLPVTAGSIKKILEIGCGTGNYTAMLANRYPEAQIAALDFSPEMIAAARHKLPQKNISFICAEAESFLAEGRESSYNLITSNGSLQWFADIDQTLSDIHRLLAPGGKMFCSIFGPDSLQELGQGLQAIVDLQGENIAAQGFPPPPRLRKALRTFFAEGTIEEEIISKAYRSAQDLLLHIRKTGTSGFHRKITQPFTASRIKQLDAWFTQTHGGCKVTYQILFLQGNK